MSKSNVIVRIDNPLHDSVVGIWEKHIEIAIKRKVNLEIHLPQGYGIQCPKLWKKTGERMEKVFKRIDEPMVLYVNKVNLIDTSDWICRCGNVIIWWYSQCRICYYERPKNKDL